MTEPTVEEIAKAREELSRAKLDSGYARCATWAVTWGDKLLSALSPAPVGEKEDTQPYKDALHDLVMLKAQQDIGCVPAPTKEQWSKAWAEAEELVRVEP